MYLRLGLPPLRPFPAAVAPWLQQAAASSEFFQVMLATLMLQAPQLWMGVVPLALQASFPAAAALGALFGSHPLWQSRGAPARAWLEAHKVCLSGEAPGLGVTWQLCSAYASALWLACLARQIGFSWISSSVLNPSAA